MTRSDQLPEPFDELGEQFAALAERDYAAQEQRRRRRRRFAVGLAVVGTSAAAATAGIAGLLDGEGDPIPEDRRAGNAPSAEPGVLLDSAAPDPSANELPWLLRVTTTSDGKTCFQLGRLRDGSFGQVARRRFRPQSQAQPICAVGAVDPVSAAIVGDPSPPRTVVFGISHSRSPIEISVGGRKRVVRPGALGGFVVVQEGLLDRKGAYLATRVDGRRLVLPLG